MFWIGNAHLDRLLTYPDHHNLSRSPQPIQIGRLIAKNSPEGTSFHAPATTVSWDGTARPAKRPSQGPYSREASHTATDTRTRPIASKTPGIWRSMTAPTRADVAGRIAAKSAKVDAARRRIASASKV